jgi:hypothetical protein
MRGLAMHFPYNIPHFILKVNNTFNICFNTSFYTNLQLLYNIIVLYFRADLGLHGRLWEVLAYTISTYKQHILMCIPVVASKLALTSNFMRCNR